ncbi:MAG: hypothetical protein O7G88_10010 [bacterium]|nr:hypothetical protein [bacterium]
MLCTSALSELVAAKFPASSTPSLMSRIHAFLAVLAEPTQEMVNLRHLLSDDQGRFPSRRSWECLK